MTASCTYNYRIQLNASPYSLAMVVRFSSFLYISGLALVAAFPNPSLPILRRFGWTEHYVAVEKDFDLEKVDDEDNNDDVASLRSMTFSTLRKDQEPELLCNFLMELGACSTSITDSDYGTDAEKPIFHEFDVMTMTRNMELPVQVWDHCDVSAHFPASADFPWIMELVEDAFPNLPKYQVAQVENKDWVLHVQQAWKPIVLPPFVLKFPWHSEDVVQKALEGFDSSADFVELKLQGGIAFGTGEHPTTQLCLDWIANVLSSKDTPIRRVMDYGAGSGVLGMAACKLDPTVTAIGVDIDVDAVQIANANVKENNVAMTNYLSNLLQTRDDESRSVLLKTQGSSKQNDIVIQALPDEWNGPIYDACVANILAGPLVALAPILAGLVRPGGQLGLSGIMSSQADMILEAYAPFFDNVKVEKVAGIWILVTGTRKKD